MQYKRSVGRTLPAVSALLMLAACSSATSISNTQSADATPVAVATTANSHAVSDVSDAVGQRLDTMLAARQANGAVSR